MLSIVDKFFSNKFDANCLLIGNLLILTKKDCCVLKKAKEKEIELKTIKNANFCAKLQKFFRWTL